MSTDSAVSVASLGDRYQVIPLSIQPDGEHWLVGDTSQGEFYQLPAEGVHILQLLQEGHTIDSIKASCQRRFAQSVDVEEFIEQLQQIGFIHNGPRPMAVASPGNTDRRLRFSVRPGIAQRFFSLPALLLYLSIVGGAAALMITDPSLRPNPRALYFPANLTLTLVLLLVLYGCTALLHEFGHMIAAARRGIDSKLGLSNRLWMIIAEADLTNIYSLPKSQRYMPLLAGMTVDCLNICSITLLIAAMIHFEVNPYVLQLLQALLLQILITLSWQFNFFLRTDVYYLLSNYYSYPDLDREARHYIRHLVYRVSGGRIGSAPEPYEYLRLSTVRSFSLFWIIGRLAAMVFLVTVLVPTFAGYASDFYHAATGSASLAYSAWDIGLFVLISGALFGYGMYRWLFVRPDHR